MMVPPTPGNTSYWLICMCLYFILLKCSELTQPSADEAQTCQSHNKVLLQVLLEILSFQFIKFGKSDAEQIRLSLFNLCRSC